MILPLLLLLQQFLQFLDLFQNGSTTRASDRITSFDARFEIEHVTDVRFEGWAHGLELVQ